MDIDLPGYAWDLLPYNKNPLDMYRSPMWHAEYDFKKRSPYASLQTSLGCVFKCDFCMINLINRNDTEEIEKDSPVYKEEDILLVSQQANVTPEEAEKALEETNGDLAQAILKFK